jgi:hypothetical protein
MLKRSCRFVVVKGEDKPQALIKELLCRCVLRGNRMLQISQACHQRDRPALRMRCMVLRRNSQAQKQSTEKMFKDSHLVKPPE